VSLVKKLVEFYYCIPKCVTDSMRNFYVCKLANVVYFLFLVILNSVELYLDGYHGTLSLLNMLLFKK
jgi:hypothetical protein